MAITNAEMADAWGDLLGLTPEKVTELAALLDQWALGGARLATWSRLATDVNLFNNAATAMVFDWYGGNAAGGPNSDGLYPLMNSEGEVELVPSPAKIMAGVSGLDPKGALASEAELPPTGTQGDLWVIDGDAYVWSMSAGGWINMGPFQGPQGPTVELRTTGTHVQWRVAGAATWINLIALADLKGADGQEIELRTNATHIQWRLGTGTWTDLIALSALKGADGREIQMQKSATHIQWRYAGVSGWTDLVPLADITPTPVPGPAAWTQVEAVVPDGERRVKQIVDWFGGDGAKPPVGQYLSATGWVATAAEAEDVRGAGGSGSGDMQGSQNLAELTDVSAARTKLSVYSKAETDTALGTKADLVGGKVPLSQIPASAITDTFVVASQAAMLALTAERGDVAVRSDLSKSFILQAEPAATLANWKELLTPTVVVPVFATVAEVWAGSVTDKIIPPSVLNAAMVPQALTIAAGTVSPDCHNGINFDIASINANITIANLANKAGKGGRSGSITGKNDATAGRTVSLGTDWKKIGTTAFPTAANALWKLVYNVDSNGVNYSVMVLTA